MPAPSSKRVEVDLYLRANKDLQQLQSALEGFGRDLGGLGGGRGGVILDPGSTTAGMAKTWGARRAASGMAPEGAPPTPAREQGGGISPYPGLRGFVGLQRGAGLLGNIRNAMNPVSSPLGEALTFGPQMVGSLARAGSFAEQLGTGGGFTQFGAQQGLSAQGGFRSPAFMAGVHNTMATYGQAFGLGNNQSIFSALQNQNLGDIKALRGGLAGMGWSGKMLDRMATAGSTNQLSAISPDLRADLMNSTRYGTASISGLAQQLRAMGTDAQAAHMSVGQFSQSVQEVIQSLGGQFGTPQSSLLGASRGAALATGLAPSIALGGVNAMTTNIQLARAAASGAKNPYTQTFGTHQGIEGAAMQSYNMVCRISGLGNNLDDAKRFLQQNGRAATLELLWKSYERARAMWPQNMTPPMFLQIIGRGMAGIQAGFNLSANVQKANQIESSGGRIGSSLLTNIEHEGVASLGGGSKAQKLIDAAVHQGGNRGQIARRIQSIVAKANQQQSNDMSAGKLNISLVGAAAEIFNIKAGDSNTRNKTDKKNGGTSITYGFDAGSGIAGGSVASNLHG